MNIRKKTKEEIEKAENRKKKKKAFCLCGDSFIPKGQPVIGDFGFCSPECWNTFQQIMAEPGGLKAGAVQVQVGPRRVKVVDRGELEELTRQHEQFALGRPPRSLAPRHAIHPSRRNPGPPEHPAVRLERLRANPPRAPKNHPQVAPDMSYGQRYAAWVDAVKEAERDLASYQRGVEDQRKLVEAEGKCPHCGRRGRKPKK